MDKKHIQIVEHHLEVERKIIHLMLNHLPVISEMIEGGFSPDFFCADHRPIVDAIYKEYSESGHKRLLTRAGYQNYLIEKGITKGNVYVAVQLHDKCFVGTDADADDLGSLKKQLTEAFIARKSQAYLADFADTCKSKGYLEAAAGLSERLRAAVSLTETRRIFYGAGADIKDEYLENLAELKKHPELAIRCGMGAVDDPVNVGFRPQHLTLFVADVGGHKCVKHDTKIATSDGSYLLAREACGKTPEFLSLRENSCYKISPQLSTRVVSNGVKECFKITTRLGFSSELTGNHPLLTMYGYKQLYELSVGQYVGIVRKMPFGTVNPQDGLAEWLGCMYTDGGTTQPTLTFSNLDDQIVSAMERASRQLGGELKQKTIHGNPVMGDYRIVGLNRISREFGLQGEKAIEKALHPDIYRWDKRSLQLFLRAAYGCDGSLVVSKNNRVSIVYSSSSIELSMGIRDLLLKFGIVATLVSISTDYNGSQRRSWQVKIRDSNQIRLFLADIGFMGYKQDVACVIKDTLPKKGNRSVDLIPPEIWTILDAKFDYYGKTYYGCRRFLKSGGDQGRGKEGHCGNRGKLINRNLLVKIAEFLDNDYELMCLADSDIVWDEIISIDSIGEHETYDVSMYKDPNFVVDNFITHNTNMMLNIGLRLAENGHGVLFIPLEMNRLDLMNRIVANRVGIDMTLLANPDKMDDKHFEMISQSDMWEKSQQYFHILDADERTSVLTLKHEIENKSAQFKPKVVIIDYVDNLEVDRSSKYGQRHIEIGEILKALRFLGKKYGFHIISAAQMNRAAIKAWREGKEEAIDSTAIHGSHQYSADSDTIFGILKVKDEPNRIKLHVIKARHGPQGQTYDLNVDPAHCLITSVSEIENMLGGTEFDTDDIVDTPEKAIEEKIEEAKESMGIDFAGALDDQPDLDDPEEWLN